MSVNVTKGATGAAGKPVRASVRGLAVPAAVAALAGLAEVFGDSGRIALRYERTPLADGELWRLVTGHLVHLGHSHALMNIAALIVLTLVLGRFLKPLDWLWLFVISALTIDAGLYWLSSGIVWYVGLSGVLHGVWAGAGISAWHIDPRQATVLTALIIAKLAFENLFGAVPLTGAVAAGPVITVAHTYGAIGGACFGFATLAIRSRKWSL